MSLELTPLTLKPFAQIRVEVDKAYEVGHAQHGQRRVISILGGTVASDHCPGKVLPGGADFQLILTPRMAELDARYTLETNDGELIYVHNLALRVAEPEITQKLIQGIPVDPSHIYFRCTPRFETASKKLEWINERIFVGSGIRRPDAVELDIFEVC